VVRTPVGVFFEGAQGIYVIRTGAPAPEFVGARVAELTASETIVRALMREDREAVSFVCASGAIFNYWHTQDRWTVDRISMGASEPATVLDACISAGRLTMLLSSDDVLRERIDGVFADYNPEAQAETGYVLAFETGWVQLDQLQGLARVWNLWLLGERRDAAVHYVLATVWTDRDASGAGQAYTYDTDAAQGQQGAAVELRLHMREQQITSLKLRVEDQDGQGDPSTYEGVAWTGIRIDWGSVGRSSRLSRETQAR
jgi:hypothetical protein